MAPFSRKRVCKSDALLLRFGLSTDLRLSFFGFLLGLDGDLFLLSFPAGDARSSGFGSAGAASSGQPCRSNMKLVVSCHVTALACRVASVQFPVSDAISSGGLQGEFVLSF